MTRSRWVKATAWTGLGLAAVLAWWLPRLTDGGASAHAQTPTAGPRGEAPAAASNTGSGARPAPGPGAASPGAAPGGRGQPAVEVAPVEVQRVVDAVPAVGTLQSRQSVTVRPEVGGRIVALGFREGAPVRRGQLLVQLDDALPRAELAQARAQLAVAQANLRRNEELVAQGFVAQRVLDESRAAVQVAQAQVDLAQARLARMRIVAPFDGVAGLRLVDVGDYVREGADLVRLEDTAQLRVEFRVPERYQAQVRRGQGVELRADALPGQTFAATVDTVDPLVDAEGRALRVRAVLTPGRDAPLRPGMFVRVGLVLGVTEGALLVPEEAIVPLGGQTLVFRVEREAGAEGPAVARRVPVRLGVRQQGRVQVLDGLRPGDTVVVAGQQRLQGDAVPVRIVGAAPRG
ncbi:Multidrug resistance protein MdtA [Tepidimonas thermarum]|uniref:Multidrug resistance protein MdtA n=1 Tax=Tepidimonas thermarum TaxID=335431 RepID=A0A554X9A1_9BURK|nr:efflux RND transporter periplasmic adaptor subunit [Tepidimonas thermarum]TSE32369.1 Multidrug resistance protein MdtA [Tepidimonas thermarum]